MIRKQNKEKGAPMRESLQADSQIAPDYPPDNGPLTTAQRQAIQNLADEEFQKNPFGEIISRSQLFQK